MTLGKLIPLILAAIFGGILVKLLRLNLSWEESAAIVILVLVIHTVMIMLYEWRQSRSSSFDKHTFKGERRLAASLQEAIIIINDKNKIEHINHAGYNLFANLRPGDDISNFSENPELLGLMKAALDGLQPSPFIYQISDPVEQYIRVTGSALQPSNNGGKTARAIIVFYDVTDLELANAMRSDFLANASHELKTPVASLLGYIETLRGHAKDDPEARSRFLGIMQQQAQRMQRLINDILSLRRIELSEHRAPTETADLYLAFRAAKESVVPMAKQKAIKVKYNGPKELLVTGQQDELVQVILNIVDNAVKMSAPESKIYVTGQLIENWSSDIAFPEKDLSPKSYRREIVSPPHTSALTGNTYAQLRIRDTGPGFTEEHLPRLSERFYRIAGDRSSKEKGTGLGLAIVKHIILRHRGGLFIETAEQVGTEFTILIPITGNRPSLS